MYQLNKKMLAELESPDSSWKSIYRLGGAAALLAVAIGIIDIVISLGGGDFSPAAMNATDWFALLQNNHLFGLRALGILNIISQTVTIPLYFAIFAAHRKEHRVCAALAFILYLVGAAVYISNNAAIPMLTLSSKYAAAASDTQRAIIAAAGEAIAAKGTDFTPGSFIGFLLTEIAGLTFSFNMLKGRIFSRVAAYSGILGFGFLIIFTVWVTFLQVLFDAAMIIAAVGGILSLLWYLLVALRLFQVAKELDN